MLSVFFPLHFLVCKKLTQMSALFVLAIVVFGYMCYVLVRPEKF
ncbi:MAG: potassium-transporting ATPase subunit F [Saprospiraceae bacterium]|nr:potassium-transporting ATPase subunit F [Saprospiraceae bacterium]